MRKSLSTPIALPSWPVGMFVQTFDMSLAPAVYALLELAHTQCVDLPPWPQWLAHWSRNGEFDPSLCLTVMDEHGIAGVVQVWTSGYLKDLVVHPRARRRGLGEALLAWAMTTCRERGEPVLDLRVREENLAALRLYQGAGLTQVRRETCPQTVTPG